MLKTQAQECELKSTRKSSENRTVGPLGTLRSLEKFGVASMARKAPCGSRFVDPITLHSGCRKSQMKVEVWVLDTDIVVYVEAVTMTGRRGIERAVITS